jgi:hypothetical protein
VIVLHTCEVSGIRRSTSVAIFVGLLSITTLAALGAATSAYAYTAEVDEFDECHVATNAAAAALEANLSPANGATVQVGTPVTFSGSFASAPTFAVASSPTLLSSPDIDSGLGSAQPGTSSWLTYTFTSTKATVTPGTVYWAASFSGADIPQCMGVPTLSSTTYTTPARKLTVQPEQPAPLPQSTVTAAPTGSSVVAPAPAVTPTPPVVGGPVGVSIIKPSSITVADPILTYRVDCTTSCSGDTYYRVIVVRRHTKASRLRELDSGPEPVSIAATAGGDDQFVHRYSGHVLRMLENIVHAGGMVEIQISAKVRNAYGNVAQAQSTARVRT